MTPQQAAAILSQPIRINTLTLKNRLVMGPMAATGATYEGKPTDQTVDFFEARAKGGIGMIIVSSSGSARAMAETPFRGGVRADTDEFTPQLARVAQAVHAHGVPIIAEISPSMGRMGRPGPGRDVIAASPLNVVLHSSPMMPVPGDKMVTPLPREATIEEIEGFEKDMIATAVRLHGAGWDGVELPAIMSYFLSSFLSPRTNWRTDRYGGSVENRARMLVNIVTGIRGALGPDFVIGLRITANDYVPGGQSPEGFAAIAREVEKAGIDYVALVTGCYEAMHLLPPDADGTTLIDPGDALTFKRTLSVPVIVGGLHDPARAAQAIADGHGDLVMEARQMLADPDYARKATEGRFDAIVRCDRRNYCIRRMATGAPVRCSVNPRMGRESRRPGQMPPLDRILKAPVEQAVLAMTRSKLVMGLVGRLMGNRH